ncbi:MAG: ABC transporter ATP-binding protein [Alphaproteobacteria bacterium]|nr:ABC transporter ATP-binding protein [Alphaproteobacteria bacterium]
MSSPAVSIRDIRKTYHATKKSPAKEALKGISLDVPRGSFFGLLGPNGAGKSTLINIMSGLVVKTSGTVEICGYDIERDLRKARGSIGVVPQELVLDVFFTVREALELHAGYYGVPAAKRRTDEIINAMGLEDKAHVPPRQLSGGMRRRLLIAKALVHAPPVLILDEPTAGVDVELRMQLWEYVRELNKQGTTVLLTTHYLEEAEELCDTIAIINHGTLIKMDSTRELMKHFDNKEVVITSAQAHAVPPQLSEAFETSIDEEGRLVLRYQPSKYTVPQVLEQVRNAGIEIHDLATREAELEDVFRSITNKPDSMAS